MAVSSGVRVGVAGADITPAGPLELEGYGGRVQPATGKLDDLAARAIVFDDGRTRAALIALDLIGVTAATTARIRAEVERACGIPRDNVVVTYSHTHGGPAMTNYVGSNADAAYVRRVEQVAASLVAEAGARPQPATLGIGEGSVEIGVNRRGRTASGVALAPSPRGLVDHRVRVLRFDPTEALAAPGTLGGRSLPQADPIAVLFAYACHPTSLRAENRRYSAEYPGAARRFVEGAYAGATGAEPAAPAREGQNDRARVGADRATLALFLPGCFGNVRPNLLDGEGRFRSATPHEVTVLGRMLGAEVVRVAERTGSEPAETIAVGRRAVQLPYADLGEAVETEVQVLRLGRHWIVALPGETVLEIGLGIERAFHELGAAGEEDAVIVLGYANDYVCYLVTATRYAEGGYEPTSWREFGRRGPFEPRVETILLEAATDLALGLASAR